MSRDPRAALLDLIPARAYVVAGGRPRTEPPVLEGPECYLCRLPLAGADSQPCRSLFDCTWVELCATCLVVFNTELGRRSGTWVEIAVGIRDRHRHWFACTYWTPPREEDFESVEGYRERWRAWHRGYLTTVAFRSLRLQALELAGHHCEVCGKRGPGLQAHHLTYDRLGHEELSDLMALCDRCHRREHDRDEDDDDDA